MSSRSRDAAATFPDQGTLRRIRRPLRAGDPGAGARPAAGGRRSLFAQRGFSSRVPPRAQDLGGPAHGAVACAHLEQALGRACLAEARGSGAHRRAQDQQRRRPDAAGQAPRRQAHHRRDRRRSARRRERGGGRAARHALRGVHGRGRRRTAGAQCRPHEVVGRHGGAGDRRRRRPCAPRSTRRCATGCPIPTAPIIPWDRRSGRIPILTWCANCSR